MFQMLSCFNLKPGEQLTEFRQAYEDFVTEMRAAGLVESSGPIGERHSDTPMDTDEVRDHQYFVIMSFRDREQVDAAYAHILKHIEPGEATHNRVYQSVADPVFICWQDIL